MNVVIFSGTTEGRALSCQVAALGAAVTVCVATDIGAEEQGNTEGITVCAGRLTADEMAALLRGAAYSSSCCAARRSRARAPKQFYSDAGRFYEDHIGGHG